MLRHAFVFVLGVLAFAPIVQVDAQQSPSASATASIGGKALRILAAWWAAATCNLERPRYLMPPIKSRI